MAFTIDQLFGQAAGPVNGSAGANSLDPSQVPAAMTTIAHAPTRHADGEPGGGTKPHSWTSIKDNPVSWLIVTLALGIALFQYGLGNI